MNRCLPAFPPSAPDGQQDECEDQDPPGTHDFAETPSAMTARYGATSTSSRRLRWGRRNLSNPRASLVGDRTVGGQVIVPPAPIDQVQGNLERSGEFRGGLREVLEEELLFSFSLIFFVLYLSRLRFSRLTQVMIRSERPQEPAKMP